MANLGQLALGSVVKINESGVPQEFYVARHDAYTAGRTLLVRRYVHSSRQYTNGVNNSYSSSPISAWLNGAYHDTLDPDIRAHIAEVVIPYTPDYPQSFVGDLNRKVFLLSLTELGATHYQARVEGTALSIADILRFATTASGSPVGQWTRTLVRDNYTAVFVFWGDGTHSFTDFLTNSGFGVRPAFTLPMSLTVHGPHIPNAMYPL